MIIINSYLMTDIQKKQQKNFLNDVEKNTAAKST